MSSREENKLRHVDGTRIEARSSYPHASASDLRIRAGLSELLKDSPIPADDLPKNLSLYQSKDVLADILSTHEVYRRALPIPGVLMEFGTMWGRRLAILMALRELYEPYDYTRRVVGFDSFAGFPETHINDGQFEEIIPGGMSTSPGYEDHLGKVLELHELDSYNSHLVRFEICKGDVHQTLPGYLQAHPETIVSLAYFDLDLYQATKDCLEILRPRLIPGSVLAFDQLAHPNYPGETVAFLESLGLKPSTVEKLPLARSPTLITV